MKLDGRRGDNFKPFDRFNTINYENRNQGNSCPSLSGHKRIHYSGTTGKGNGQGRDIQKFTFGSEYDILQY